MQKAPSLSQQQQAYGTENWKIVQKKRAGS